MMNVLDEIEIVLPLMMKFLSRRGFPFTNLLGFFCLTKWPTWEQTCQQHYSLEAHSVVHYCQQTHLLARH